MIMTLYVGVAVNMGTECFDAERRGDFFLEGMTNRTSSLSFSLSEVSPLTLRDTWYKYKRQKGVATCTDSRVSNAAFARS